MPDETPRNAASVMECGICHGEGAVTVAGYSVNPFSGVPVCDPQEAHDERCPACGGTGEPDPDAQRDWDRDTAAIDESRAVELEDAPPLKGTG